jgi:hypothetical protein
MAALTLLDAIRRCSNIDLWTEFEEVIGLPSTKGPTTWNDNDQDAYRFRLELRLKAIQERTRLQAQTRGDIEALHLWAKLRKEFLSRLRSGSLVATGYAEPVQQDSKHISIPADKWHLLQLDFLNARAGYESLQFVDVRVSEVKTPTVAAETECRRWLESLSDQISSAVSPLTKEAVFGMARKKFGARLSGRAFQRAWTAAAPENWRKAGRKSRAKSTH